MRTKRRRFLLVGIAALVAGCLGAEGATMLLATTTSVQNSGLLDAILPTFRDEAGIEVRVTAVGTGRALELGRRGDADALIAHAPREEERFMAEGHGDRRLLVMRNEFFLVGPDEDPAGVRGASNVTHALARVRTEEARFASRGDGSGTHIKERELWTLAGLDYEGDVAVPGNEWYASLGRGMGDTLFAASEMRAYTLTDDGTFYALADRLDLVVLSENEPALDNPYHVITVDPLRHPEVDARGADRFADWLVGPSGQAAIGAFRSPSGRPLFAPAAGEAPS
ncbi:MAG: substrate-binding domain-containing protein [Methanobacteriota archaeon]